MADPLSELSKDVLQTLERWKVPVNPFDIAMDEDIQLAPGEYSDGFDARIEYIPEVKRFVIYYRLPGLGRSEGRVHFSLAHELGHFYIPRHRKRLLKGEMHNSLSDFRSRDPHELEADEFAANLLMPKDLFIREVRRFTMQVCNLKEICRMANERFHTSITSTARRYCQCDIEACSIVVSEKGNVRWAMHSEEMKAQNMRYIAAGQPVPNLCHTAELWDELGENGFSDSVEGLVDSDIWFESPYYRKELWEEAMPLGNTGLVMTFLTLDSE